MKVINIFKLFSAQKPPKPTRQEFFEAELSVTEIQKHIHSLSNNPASSGMMNYHALECDFRQMFLNMRRP